MGTRSVSHFIITRFNLRAPGEAGALQIDERYLGERMELFERFCVPTVRSQTRQDFKWLVLFAADTPAPFKARIERLAEWPPFVPVYIAPGTEHVGRLVVAPYLDDSPRTLITTRLDNDDGLCRSYVEDIRRHADVQERTVLQFPRGFVWHRGRIYLDRQDHNAFSTLVEPLENGAHSPYLTIYKGSHSELHRLGRVVNVDDEPGWLQVIHGGNAENFVRGSRRPIGELRRRFDVVLPTAVDDETGAEIYLDRARVLATSTSTRLFRSLKSRLARARSR
jgi:hypothetical protein